ncbi:MAG: NUDIX domain-containing protein [Chloroflexota bacterium]|nr:NUDIX domain-containing protein [Chloroflexota bacterium]
MITFTHDNKKFTYRIAGVVISNNAILFQKAVEDKYTFWFLPGGRAELSESAQETLKREMREELDLDIKVERLLWVVENFFDNGKFLVHELGLYFLMTFPEDAHIYSQGTLFEREHAGDHLVFEWLPIDSLATASLYPSFLKKVLHALPDRTQHLVHT